MKFFFLLMALASVTTISAQELIEVWKTDTVFRAPESAIYDADTKYIYVANINGNSSEKDGNGFISRVKPDGTIDNLQWSKGLHAPKGMAIHKGKLFVSDVDALVSIDLATGKQLQRYSHTDAVFLNDVAVSRDGTVYVSDSRTNKIYKWQGRKLELFMEAAGWERANGLWVEGDYLYLGSTKVHKIHRKSRKVTELLKEAGGIDGLERWHADDFVYSHWAGRVYYWLPGSTPVLMMDVSSQKINTADIFYARDLDLLLIPTFNDHRLMAYRIQMPLQ